MSRRIPNPLYDEDDEAAMDDGENFNYFKSQKALECARAIIEGDTGLVEELLVNHLDVSENDNELLLTAVNHSCSEAVEMLLKHPRLRVDSRTTTACLDILNDSEDAFDSVGVELAKDHRFPGVAIVRQMVGQGCFEVAAYALVSAASQLFPMSAADEAYFKGAPSSDVREAFAKAKKAAKTPSASASARRGFSWRQDPILAGVESAAVKHAYLQTVAVRHELARLHKIAEGRNDAAVLRMLREIDGIATQRFW